MIYSKHFLFFLLFLTLLTNVSAQVPDSVRQYVVSCMDVMKKESLYSKNINWKKTKKDVFDKLKHMHTQQEAEILVVDVFSKLKDSHGMYGGIDTSYRYTKPGPSRTFSNAILSAYTKPRAVKTAILENNIAYFRMPAVIIGSNTTKMKEWANILSDSLRKLENLQPRAYIIDLRLNNGGNIEPMWQALKGLIGESNRTYMANAQKKILADETDTATLRYKAAAIPNEPCLFRPNIPVAVLIGPGTASSGEIIALSFTTRPSTRLFGEPTIGVANVTNGFVIENKGYLLLTVGYIADANKNVLKTFQLQPATYVSSENDNFNEPGKDPTVMEALKWLQSTR